MAGERMATERGTSAVSELIDRKIPQASTSIQTPVSHSIVCHHFASFAATRM